MDYIDQYRKLIYSRLKLNRNKKEGIYYENHHIVPKCLGGSNRKENLILLTAKEHYIAHLLLHAARPHSKGLGYGLWCLCTMSNGIKIKSARTFQYLRENVLTKLNPSKKLINREKSSVRMIGSKNPMSQESLSKNKKIHPNKNRNVSDEYGDKISKSLKEYFKTHDNPYKNKTHSIEIRKKISENTTKALGLRKLEGKQIGGAVPKKIEINGITYQSAREASKLLNISYYIIMNQLYGNTKNKLNIKRID